MTPEFERAVEHVIEAEGGYVNDPHDRGGATNMGVAERFVRVRDYDRDGRKDFDFDGDGDVDFHDMRLMPKAAAVLLYHQDYWEPLHCDALPAPIALALFDAGVNQGRAAAARMLQDVLGAKVDGVLGPDTIARAHRLRDAYAAVATAEELLLRRADRYRKHKQADRYFRGWIRRLLHVHAAIQEAKP